VHGPGANCRQELGVLRRHGIATVVLAPGVEVLEHITPDFMSDAQSNDIVAASFLDTGRQLRGLRAHRDQVAPSRAGEGSDRVNRAWIEGSAVRS
jgi:hypothetical protein